MLRGQGAGRQRRPAPRLAHGTDGIGSRYAHGAAPPERGVLRIIPAPLPLVRCMADDDPQDSRYAVGSGPINRRTAARRLQEAGVDPDGGAANEALLRRAQQLQARHRVGAPLAVQLQPVARAPMRKRVLALALGGSSALSASLFAQGPVSLGLALGVGATCLGAALWQWQRGQRRALAVHLPPLVRAEVLEALDAQLERAAPELPDSVLQALLPLKQGLAQLLELAQDPQARATLVGEDAYYPGACAERYLPEALQTFLRLPAAQRAQQGEGSASQTLLAQLELMQQTLARLEAQLAAASAEALERQRRFLQAKAKT